ncbi:MAG TPA: PilZ domain-containing protein [Bdellovibrionota bacterium]|jgi:hypothetical protein|nr:PilZ domain-containing protein [Bdellovibrionota bacterium]
MGKTPSHNLEVISGHSEDHEGLERRRVPRLNLTAEQFQYQENGKVYSVSDLSIGGMSLRILEAGDLSLFTVGHTVSGMLNLHRVKFPISAQVRHLRPDLAGLAFTGLDGETKAALEKFLDPAELAHDLRAMPAATDESASWFHGPTGTDVLVWRLPSGNLGRMAVFLFGTFVQWDPDAGLSTGRTLPADEQSEVRGAVRFDTLLLEPDAKPDAGKLNLAKTLVLSSNMPSELKNWCTRRIESRDN